jgi:hypothetical protein
MKRRNFVLGLGTAAAGGSVVLGSGSFSRDRSHRDVTIETVGDDDAYLVLQYQDISFECAGTVTLVTLTNHFPEPLTDIQVAVSVSNNGITLTNVVTPDSLDVGESGMVTVDAVCESDSATATVSFNVEASGEESAVEAMDRSVQATCNCTGGNEPTGGSVPSERVDEPPHDPQPPSDKTENAEWNDHWRGSGMATEPSYVFGAVPVSLTDPQLDGAPPPWRSKYAARLVTSPVELETIVDMESAPEPLQTVDFDEQLVVVVESGYGPSSVEHVWRRVEAVEDGVYLHGYYTDPLEEAGDYSARYSAVVVETPATADDRAHVSLTVDENRRVNVNSSEGVVTVDEQKE